jgi:hypothetical protein
VIHETITFAGLVACCLWFGWAREEEHPGQMGIAIIGAFVFGAWMYLW